jgi:hypothetical protein
MTQKKKLIQIHMQGTRRKKNFNHQYSGKNKLQLRNQRRKRKKKKNQKRRVVIKDEINFFKQISKMKDFLPQTLIGRQLIQLRT